MTEKKLFYKIYKPGDKEQVIKELSRYLLSRKDIGLLGGIGFNSLNYKDAEGNWYFSYEPIQITGEPQTKEEIINDFEKLLTQEDIKFKRFDLDDILSKI